MKLASALFAGFVSFVVYAQATPGSPPETPTTGEFTRSPGTVIDTRKMQGKMSAMPFKRSTPTDDEVLTLDLGTISAPIQPGDANHVILPSHTPAIRGRSRATLDCPPYAPWTCDGVTCFNFFTHNCCKGGVVCKDPDVCVRNYLGEPACHKN